jgi:hypothetical protein
MPVNSRVYFATHSVALKQNGGALTFTTGHLLKGAQSVGITSNFNITPLFSLGYLPVYENLEGIPDVEVNIQKALDGYPLAFHLATTAATEPDLGGRSVARTDIGLAVYADTKTFASGTPVSVCAISGAYINSVSYNFSTDGSFTEDTSYVANDKIWTRFPGTATGTPNYGEADLVTMPTITWNAHMAASLSPIAVGGVAQSEDFLWDLPTSTGTLTGDTNGAVNHPDVTVLPTEIQGITLSGTNPTQTGGDVRSAHIQTASVSVSFNRESITELGRRGPYSRSIQFPVEVTAEFTSTTSEGDLVSHTSRGIFGSDTGALCSVANENLRNRTIRLCTCEGTRIYLGRKNKLSSVSYAGGDAGGGNVTTTYGYTTQNEFTVMHQRDPHPSGATWWAERSTNGYLIE